MKTVKTIWSALVESYKLFNRPLVLPNYVTLNEKYGIASIDNDITKLSLGYYTIGIGSSSISATTVHNSSDREVFTPVPFLIVPTSTGLTAAQLNTYMMREVRVINNVEYILCHAKKVTAITVDNLAYLVEYNQAGQVFTPTEYAPPQAYTSTPTSGTCDGTGLSPFYAISSKISMQLTLGDIANINAASNILYGNATPTISEVGIYAGIEDTAGELSNAIPYMFKGIELDNYNTDGSISVIVNIGGMTPI